MKFLGVVCSAFVLWQGLPKTASAARVEQAGLSITLSSPRSVLNHALLDLQAYSSAQEPSQLAGQFLNQFNGEVLELHSSLDFDKAFHASWESAQSNPKDFAQALRAESSRLAFYLIASDPTLIASHREEWAQLLGENQVQAIEGIIRRTESATNGSEIRRIMEEVRERLLQEENPEQSYAAFNAFFDSTKPSDTAKFAIQEPGGVQSGLPESAELSAADAVSTQENILQEPALPSTVSASKRRYGLFGTVTAGVVGAIATTGAQILAPAAANLLDFIGVGPIVTGFFTGLGRMLHQILGDLSYLSLGWLVDMIYMIGLTPIREELICRAAIMGGLFWLFSRVSKRGALPVSIIASSILFVGMHYSVGYTGDLSAIVAVFSLSLVLSGLYLRFGLPADIVAHGLTNLNGFNGLVSLALALLWLSIAMWRIPFLKRQTDAIRTSSKSNGDNLKAAKTLPYQLSAKTAFYLGALFLACSFILSENLACKLFLEVVPGIGLIIYSLIKEFKTKMRIAGGLEQGLPISHSPTEVRSTIQLTWILGHKPSFMTTMMWANLTLVAALISVFYSHMLALMLLLASLGVVAHYCASSIYNMAYFRTRRTVPIDKGTTASAASGG